MQFNRAGLQMWLRWVIASSAGLVLGLLISLGITNTGNDDYRILSSILGGAAVGLCLASVQVLSVNQYMKMGRWILASVIGYSVGFFLMYLIDDLFQFSALAEVQDRTLLFFGEYAGIIGVLVGTPVGIMQWWNFRKARTSIIEWVLISISAIGVSLFTFIQIMWLVNADQAVGGMEIPAILLPPTLIFSTVSWLPVIRSRETNAQQSELSIMATPRPEGNTPIDT